MPKMVMIEANPDFKPATVAEKEVFAAARKAGPIEVSTQTAMENLRNSGGLYRMVPTAQPEAVVAVPKLNEMTNEDLKLLILNLGIKTEKQMKKSEMVGLIQARLDAIEIIDDTEQG